MEAKTVNKGELVKIFSIFNVVYPKFIQEGKDEIMLDVWYSMLKEFPYDLIKCASEAHIRSSSYSPTIYDIIKYIQEFENFGKLDGMEAWGCVKKSIREYGYYQQNEALKSLPQDIQSVVKSMGWENLCVSKNDVGDRAHFIKAYETMQKREKQSSLFGHLLQNVENVYKLEER